MGRLFRADAFGHMRWSLVPVAMSALLAGSPASAQLAAYSAALGSPPPAASPTPSSSADNSDDSEAARQRGDATPATGPAGTQAPAEIPFFLKELFYRRLSPPAGTRLSSLDRPAYEVNPRLGAIAVEPAAAGRRLGGGTDSPSFEAVTIDPRDFFDAHVTALSDPRQ